MYDFLFVYEVKNRELENICLLKTELERRGYSVKLYETWYAELHYIKKVKARVVVTFAFYCDDIIGMLQCYAKDIRKIVNLQWEQVFNIADENDTNCLHNIKDNAKNAMHISWGKNNHDRLVNINHVCEDNVSMCGQIAFDFYKPRLNGYYYDRDEICKISGLDSNKPIHLFISSFSWVDIPDSELDKQVYQKVAFDIKKFQKISKDSQEQVLEWYEKIAGEYPDIQIVYRPHPAEIGNSRLNDIQNKHSNFFVIKNHSVKQWILISDSIATWYSTAIVEVYAAKKNCAVLRPIFIPYEMDIRMYYGCDAIISYERLKDFITGGKYEFPLNENIINSYYNFDDSYSYVKVCDTLIKVLKEDKYDFPFDSVCPIKNELSFVRWLKQFLKRMIVLLCKSGCIHSNNPKINNFIYADKMTKNNYATENDINDICEKLKRVIDSNSP